MKRLAIVAPAYNEEDVIQQFIEGFDCDAMAPLDFELVIVNDGSRDRTPEIVASLMARYPFLRLINHDTNKGLGKALETGLNNARGRFIVTMDADLTHPVALIPRLVDEMERCHICIASRYVKGGGMRDVPGWRMFVSRLANGIFNVLFLTTVKDLTTGFKCYKTEIMQPITINAAGFACQLEIMVRCFKKGVTVREIPFVLENRRLGSSKFNFFRMLWRYGLNVLQLFYLRWFGARVP